MSKPDPDSMTAEERRLEVADLLACGLLRRLRAAGTAVAPPATKTSNFAQNGLDLPSKTRLSVAHDPRVNGSDL